MKTRTNPQPPSRNPTLVADTVLEQLFDTTPETVFFMKDDQGRYTVVNHSLVERTGLQSKAQMIGRRTREICSGDFGRIPSEQDANVLRTGRPLIDHLELHWYAPRKPGWCLTTKLPIHDVQGRVSGLIGISRDVRAPIVTKDIPFGFAAALDHFEQHVDEPMTPSELARRAKLPATRFARLMKRFFGLTPSQFITKTRVAAASRLLQDTDQTIADIALACGFCDHSAFTRAFRSAAGVTPTHFRAQSR